MSAQIIDPKRYKKTTREKSKKEKEARRQELKKDKKGIHKKQRKTSIKEKSRKNVIQQPIGEGKLTWNEKKSKIGKDFGNSKIVSSRSKKKKRKYQFIKILKVCGLVIAIIGISLISKKVASRYFKESGGDVTVHLNSGKTVSYVQDSVLKIGISKTEQTDLFLTRNVILNEIYRLAYPTLLTFDDEYHVTYQAAKEVEKINNKEYLIILEKEAKIDYEDIAITIQKIQEAGEQNIYYQAIHNIEQIQEIEKGTMKITLLEENPYFIYSLNFPILGTKETQTEYEQELTVDNELKFTRKNSSSTVKEVIVKNYLDIDPMIEDFRNHQLDIFTASSDSIMSLVGKYDYSVKKYRDGDTLFLLGNKDSRLFSKKEIRKAILYSIDRDQIIRNLNGTFLEKIDIPCLYSRIQYKYDVYGAQNALLSQGWVKSSGIYTKKEEEQELKLELTLLVNQEDKTKVKVAGYLKEMLEKNGMKLFIKELAGEEFQKTLEAKDYDMVLANISLNEVPNLAFLEDTLKLNDTIASAFSIFKNGTIEEVAKNLNSLQNTLSNEIACIGIYASNTNVVYQTNVAGFSNITYMNLLNRLKEIGKIQNSKDKE